MYNTNRGKHDYTIRMCYLPALGRLKLCETTMCLLPDIIRKIAGCACAGNAGKTFPALPAHAQPAIYVEYFELLHRKLRNHKSNNSKEYWIFLIDVQIKKSSWNVTWYVTWSLKKIEWMPVRWRKECKPIIDELSVNEDISVEFRPKEIKSIVKKVEKWESMWLRSCKKRVPYSSLWWNLGYVYKFF